MENQLYSTIHEGKSNDKTDITSPSIINIQDATPEENTRRTSRKSRSSITDFVNEVGNSLRLSRLDSKKGDHCHGKNNNPDSDELAATAKLRLKIAIFLCLLFMITECIGGFLAGSLAILADAGHLFTDLIALGIGIISIHLKSRPASKQLSFGWSRAEILGSLLSIALIWLITGILVYVAARRIYDQDYEVEGTYMLITAGAGVAFNLIIGIALGGSEVGHLHSHGGGGGGHSLAKTKDKKSESVSSHSHSMSTYGAADHSHSAAETGDAHGHSHDAKKEDHGHAHAPKQDDVNVRAAFIHVIGDLFQSVGVLIAAYIIYYYPEYAIADPICTFIFSIIVLITTYRISGDLLHVLMEGAPKDLNYTVVKDAILKVPCVVKVHNLRLWSLTLTRPALSVHVAIKRDNQTAQDVLHALSLKQVTEVLNDEFNIYETTIQIEEYIGEMENCVDCKDPAEK